MAKVSNFALLAASLAAVAGCTTDATPRNETLTPGAGNAIAANSVLQMVDPWQPGVQNTRLRVPADRGGQGGSAADKAASAKQSQTMTNN